MEQTTITSQGRAYQMALEIAKKNNHILWLQSMVIQIQSYGVIKPDEDRNISKLTAKIVRLRKEISVIEERQFEMLGWFNSLDQVQLFN